MCDVWKPNTLQLAPATTQSCDVSTVFHSVDSISLRDQSCCVSSIYSLRLLSSDKINEDHFKVIYFQDCMSTDTLEKYLYITENHRSITHNSLDYFTTKIKQRTKTKHWYLAFFGKERHGCLWRTSRSDGYRTSHSTWL